MISKGLVVEEIIYKICSHHHIAEILLKLALNTNRSIIKKKKIMKVVLWQSSSYDFNWHKTYMVCRELYIIICSSLYSVFILHAKCHSWIRICLRFQSTWSMLSNILSFYFSFYVSAFFCVSRMYCCISFMCEWLLFSAKWAFFQLFHGENKLIFNEMIMRSTLY